MRKYFILFLLIILASLVCAGDLGAIEKDSFAIKKISSVDGFEKVKINDEIIAFTNKGFEKENIFIGTDKLFYGSGSGQVDLNIFIGSLNPKNYKVVIEVENDKKIIIKEYKINNLTVKPTAKQTSNFEIPNISFKKEIKYISMTLLFNPQEIGFATKFNVVVYDLLGNKVYELDPYLSGYNERYALNIGSTHSEITMDYTHSIKAVDVSAWDCTDTNQIAIAYHDGTPNEIHAIITGTCGTSTDAIIDFNGQTNIPANTGLIASDDNGYYAYVTNDPVPAPLRDCSKVYYVCDDFENGNITGWSEEEGGNNFSATNTQAKRGVYSMTGTSGAWFSYPLDPVVFDENITIWARVQSVVGNGASFGVGYGHAIAIGFNRDLDDKLSIYSTVSGNQNFDGTNPDVLDSKWYKLVIHPIDATHSNLYVLDTDGTTILGYKLNFAHNDFTTKYVIYADTSSEVIWADDFIRVKGIVNSPVYTIGALETEAADYNIIFNVFQYTGADFDLNNLTIDFNVDAYDQTNVNSPVTINDVNTGDYLITISKTNWDSNSDFVLTVDANKNLTYYIDKFVYPTLAQFEVAGAKTVSQSSYQNVGSFSYATTYGASTQTNIGCSFWATSNNATIKTASWRVQSSTDGVNWTTRKETTRTISANTTGGSIYIVTPDFNIVDGTQYFRLQHKISSSNFDLNTNNVICHNCICRDHNNFIIQSETDSPTNLSTSETDYTLLRSGNFSTDPFNGFMYYYGDMVYDQTVAKGISYIRGDLKSVPDSNSAEYPRTTEAGSTGIGGFSGRFEDLNRATPYTIQTYGKTTAGTIDFSYTLHLKYLNQRPSQYDQNKLLTGGTLTSNSLIKIATLNINPLTQGDFRAITVLPFSCSDASCDFNTLIAVSGAGYDVNSLSHKRTSNATPDDIGVLVNQFLFEDVNIGVITIDLYASTSTGTITLQGGSFSIIKANQKDARVEYLPNPPLIYAPTNREDVNGSAVDYNCFATDPDNDVLTYDVNVIYHDTNATALVLETDGDGYGDFNSSLLANGTYTFTCIVDDGNFTSAFDDGNYFFTITNVPPPAPPTPADDSGVTYNRYYAPYDDRIDLNQSIKFVNDKLVANESVSFRNDQNSENLLIGIIILLGVLILLGLFIFFKGKK